MMVGALEDPKVEFGPVACSQINSPLLLLARVPGKQRDPAGHPILLFIAKEKFVILLRGQVFFLFECVEKDCPEKDNEVFTM